jgi:hypothetical protein
MANAEAIPLFFLLLREADLNDALWGLAVWYRLAVGSLVNAHACQRAGVFPLLLDWLTTTGPPCNELQTSRTAADAPTNHTAVSEASRGGLSGFSEASRGGLSGFPMAEVVPLVSAPHPRLQVRLSLLLQALAPHAMSAADFRRLLQLMLPQVTPEGSKTEGSGMDVWKVLLARLASSASGKWGERGVAAAKVPVVTQTSLLAQKLLCRCGHGELCRYANSNMIINLVLKSYM